MYIMTLQLSNPLYYILTVSTVCIVTVQLSNPLYYIVTVSTVCSVTVQLSNPLYIVTLQLLEGELERSNTPPAASMYDKRLFFKRDVGPAEAARESAEERLQAPRAPAHH